MRNNVLTMINDDSITIKEENVMALLRCPECGQAVSEQAARCPNRGCPVGGMDQTDPQPVASPKPQQTVSTQSDHSSSVSRETYTQVEKKKKKGGGGKIAALLLILVLIIGGIASAAVRV